MKNKIKAFISYIDSIGGKHEENWTKYSYLIETIYGPLRVSIHDSDYTKMGKVRANHNNFVSIFTSFRNDKAKEFVIKMGGNRFSYKLNFHQWGGEDIQKIWDRNFQDFKNFLDKILVKS